MKSDWDDAPDYLRSKKKHGPWRMVVILGMGSAITWGVISLFGKPIVIDIDQLKQAIRIDGQPLFSRQSVSPSTESEPSLRLPSVPLDPVPQNHQQQAQTQEEWFEENTALAIERSRNVFNDSNYTPRQPDNTYTPPAVQRVAAAPTPAPAPSQRQTRRVQREHTSIWIRSWNGGSRYLAEWVSLDNYIDSSSVCSNQRRGSIDYRECRKAAKQHFHEECRNWRARYDNDRKDYSDRMKTRYCSASSSFSPMG